MTTAATARPYTGADVPQGPAEVWIKVAVPAANTPLVLHTDGSVDSTLNTTAVFLGKLKAGAKFAYKPSFFEGVSDESASSFRDLISAEELTISGEWMEVQSAVKLTAMMVGATNFANATSPASSLIQIGGLTIPPTFTVAMVWTQPEAATKFISIQLYKALNMGETSFDITKKALGSSPFSFKALSLDSRAVGDRLGAINVQT